MGSNYAGTLDKLMARVQRDPRPIEEVRSDIPPKLAAIIARMLTKDPRDRFATPAELAAALQPWTSGSDLPALAARAKRIDPANLPPEIATPGRIEPYSPVAGQKVPPVEVEPWGSWKVWLKTAVGATVLLLLVGLVVPYCSGPPKKPPTGPPAAKPAADKRRDEPPRIEKRPTLPADTRGPPLAKLAETIAGPGAAKLAAPEPRRPAHWYRQAEPQAPPGLAKIKIQKRLEEASHLRVPVPGGK